jgi:hypothetical protein
MTQRVAQVVKVEPWKVAEPLSFALRTKEKVVYWQDSMFVGTNMRVPLRAVKSPGLRNPKTL